VSELLDDETNDDDTAMNLIAGTVGEEIAVYLNKPKVFILNWKKMEVK
jgi:hypothetical protein